MSSEQLPLVAYDGRPPRQRHSDTSHEAADSIEVRLGRLQRQVLDYLAKGGHRRGDPRPTQYGSQHRASQTPGTTNQWACA